jgi:hypothetical protein
MSIGDNGGDHMARRVFYSFHHKPDSWRASQVRNAGVVEGNREVSDNDWEAIKKSGAGSIKKWIDGQLSGRSCTVVLIGSSTAGRKWINYEIQRSWADGKGLLGIYVHNLKDGKSLKSAKGRSPFEGFSVGSDPLTSIIKAYDPPYTGSKNAYDYIKSNLGSWVEEAIAIRKRY